MLVVAQVEHWQRSFSSIGVSDAALQHAGLSIACVRNCGHARTFFPGPTERIPNWREQNQSTYYQLCLSVTLVCGPQNQLACFTQATQSEVTKLAMLSLVNTDRATSPHTSISSHYRCSLEEVIRGSFLRLKSTCFVGSSLEDLEGSGEIVIQLQNRCHVSAAITVVWCRPYCHQLHTTQNVMLLINCAIFEYCTDSTQLQGVDVNRGGQSRVCVACKMCSKIPSSVSQLQKYFTKPWR